jgi:hypothetical protein
MNPYLSKYSFERPLYLPESAWHKHCPFAFWLLWKLKPHTIVELGVHNGFSFFVFCEYAQKNKDKIMCYAIDHWIGDEHAGFFDDSIYNTFIEQQQKYINVSKVIKASFDDAVNEFEDGSIDFLHIDGRHFYEDVKHDFNNWKRKLANDALVLFHDTTVFTNGFGVYQFWDELKKEFPLTFEFTHGHGLGVLCNGSGLTLPTVIYKLFKAPETQRKNIQMIYRSLGNQIHYEYLLKAFNVPFNND